METTTWGSGGGVTLLAVHATGLCKEVLRPMVSHLAASVPAGRVIAVDQRGHGDSAVPELPFSWWDAGGDVLAVLGGEQRVVGFGHSSGATAVVLAELTAPGTFSAMVLVEPIVFPPGTEIGDDHPLVRSAQRRKPSFPDRAAAAANFSGKPPFATWRRDALDAYLGHALAPGPDGYRLKCPPEAEADFYRGSVRHGAWDRLGEIACPVVLVAGEHSDSHAGGLLDAQAARFADVVAVESVPDAGHFVVTERPEAVAAVVARAVDLPARR